MMTIIGICIVIMENNKDGNNNKNNKNHNNIITNQKNNNINNNNKQNSNTNNNNEHISNIKKNNDILFLSRPSMPRGCPQNTWVGPPGAQAACNGPEGLNSQDAHAPPPGALR